MQFKLYTSCLLNHFFGFVLLGLISKPALAQNFLNQNFNAAILPAGWVVTPGGNTAETWEIRNPGTYSGVNISFTGSRHLWCNGDPSGPTTIIRDVVTSPAVNTNSSGLLFLEFKQYFRDYLATNTDTAIVEVFDGTAWRRVQAATNTIGGPQAPFTTLYNITQFRAINMRVRFRFVGDWPWYWLVDDVRIFQPPPNDVGMSTIITPSGTCGLSANSLITARLGNFGSLAQTTIPVGYRINNGAPVIESFSPAGGLVPSASANYAFTTRTNLAATGSYIIKVWTQLTGDANLSNDTSSIVVVRQPAGNIQPVTFTGYSGTNLPDISPGWSNARGTSPVAGITAWRASNTVQTDHLGSVAAAINLFSIGKRDWFISPSFPVTNSTGLTFKAAVTTWQNIQPATMGSDDSVKVFVSTDCGANWQLISFLNRSSNLPNVFREFTVPLSAFNGLDIQIGIMATEGTIDNLENYDLHIDDIFIRTIPATDLTTSAIVSPISGCTGTPPVLRANVRNVGYEAQSNFPVCYTINGTAPVCQTFSGTLEPGQETSIIFAGATAILNPPGNYSISVYTNLATDQNRQNDSLARYNFQNIPLINTFPYFESFETNNGGWIPGGTNPSWELGTPAKSVIQGAGQGTKAYVTGGLGTENYNNNEKSFVLGPCMDFTNLANPVFEMRAWWHSEAADGAALQASTNGGNTWVTIGLINAVTNWYNTFGVQGLIGVVNPPNGWSGGLNQFNGSNGWVLVRSTMVNLGGRPDVRLRIAFGSDANTATDGFAFDAIRITQQPTPDLAMVSIERPLPEGCGLTASASVAVRVQNVSRDTVRATRFGYSINGGAPVNENVATLKIAPNQFYIHNFTTTQDLSTQNSYEILAWAKPLVDNYDVNDTLQRRLNRNGALTDTIRFNGFNNLNLGALWPGWRVGSGTPNPINNSSQWRPPFPDQIPFVSNRAIRVNMSGLSNQDWIIAPGYKIEPNSFLSFEVAITEGFEITDDPTGGFNGTDDQLRIMVSSNCGESWSLVSAVDSADNINRVFRRIRVNLSAYVNQEIRLAFYATTGLVNNPNDYDLFLREIYIESIAPVDGGITAILSPNISCGLTDQTEVRVLVRNFGSTPISNFPIYYRINGAAPFQENFSGTLAPQESAPYTFLQRADLSQSQPYQIVAGTQVPNDVTLLNNESGISLTKVVAPVPVAPLAGYNGSNLGTIWPGWSEGIGANIPVPSNAAWTNADIGAVTSFKVTLANNQKQDWIVSPGIRIGTENFLKFNVGIFSVGGTNAAQFDIDDSVSVMVSTNCGQSWTHLYGLKSTTIPAITNSMQEYSISLAAFEGQDIRIGFRARDGFRADFTSDFYINRIQITTSITLDAGPIELIFTPGPIGRTFLLNDAYQVSVRVKNFGLQTLTSVPVAVRFAGGNVLTGQFTGNLLLGQSAIVSLGNVNFNTVGVNLVAKAYTSLQNDQQIQNDTLVFNYQVADQNAIDASTTELILTPLPQNNTLRAGTSYQVAVRVANFGLQAITTLPVGARFADGTTFTQNFTGSLIFGQTAVVNLGNYSPTTAGANLVAKGYVNIAGDEVPANDTTRYTYNITDLFNVDASATEVIFDPVPNNNVLRQNQQYQVSVRVANLGLQAITSLPVGIRFADGTALSQIFTGNISTGANSVVALGNYTPQVLGTGFAAKAFTSLLNDERVPNDTLRYTYSVSDLLNNDASLTEITFTPAVNNNELRQNFPYQVSVRVTNLGTLPINNMHVGIRFADGSVLSQTFTGSLNTGQTSLVSLGSYNAPDLGNAFVAKAYTALVADQRVANDTLSLNYSVVPNNCRIELPPKASVLQPQFLTDNLPSFRLVAGQTLNFRVEGKDSTDRVSLSVFSTNLNLGSPGLSFTTNPDGGIRAIDGTFNWATTCSNASGQPYRISFVVTDSSICWQPLSDTITALVFVDSDAPLKNLYLLYNGDTLRKLSAAVLNKRSISFQVLGESDKPLEKVLAYTAVSGNRNEQFQVEQSGNSVRGLFSYTGRCEDVSADSLIYNFTLSSTWCQIPSAQTIRVALSVKDSVPAAFVPPNVVTRNGDGKNDSWYIYESIPVETCSFVLEQCKIYNRWGKLVFESTDPAFQWKPGDNERGTFLYFLRFNSKTYKGWLEVFSN